MEQTVQQKVALDEFNTLVEQFDFLTQGRYERVTNVAALLYYAGEELGHDSSFVRQLKQSARTLGYKI